MRIIKYSITIFILLLSTKVFAIDQENVSIDETQANHFAEYTITFRSQAQGQAIQLFGFTIGWISLRSGLDQITLTFDDAVTLPESISSSDITMDGVVVQSASINGQAITFTVPENLDQNTTTTIVISSAAGIRNPSTTGSYDIDVNTTLSGLLGQNESGATNTYTIISSTTTVDAAAVTPNPSLESTTAAYTIGFNVGDGGYLDVGSEVTITFPSAATVPVGLLSGISFNGSSTTAIGELDGSDKNVRVNVPIEVNSNGSVLITISEGVGISNPTNGTYNLNVSTSSETSPVSSDNFSISSAANLSFSSVDVANDTVNAKTTTSIEAVLSSSGAMSASSDQFRVTFPNESFVPSTIATNAIVISNLTSGFSNNPTSVTVVGQQIQITTSLDFANQDEVELFFKSSSGILNPVSAGNYQLTLETTESDGTNKDGPVSSNPFAVVNTTSEIENATISLSNYTASTTSNYAISTITGKYGRLVGGTSTITVKFPSGTNVSTVTTATINSVNVASITPDNTSKEVMLLVPSDVGNQSSMDIVINNITNDANGDYVLYLKSSSEDTYNASNSFSIGSTPLTINSVTLTNNTTNEVSGYTFAVSNTDRLGVDNFFFSLGNDNIRVDFPSGTVLPETIAATDVELNNSSNDVQSVDVDQETNSVRIYIEDDANIRVSSIEFETAAGIINPAVPSSSFYTATISTSAQTQPVVSPIYSINGDASSRVVVNSVSVTPSAVSASPSSYEIEFTTGSNGRLVNGEGAGTDTILVQFPNSLITLPASVAAEDILINDNPVAFAQTNGSTFIYVGVPENVEIGNSTSATILFTDDVGIVNSAAGNGEIQVRTSTERTFSSSGNNITTTAESNLSFTSVSVSPSTTNSAASYIINFRPGTGDGLSIGDKVKLTFPSGVFIPDVISNTHVLIGGQNPSVNPTVNGDEVTIITPIALAEVTEHTIQISFNAEILNPISAGSTYRVGLETLNSFDVVKEAQVNSSQYSIQSATSSVSSSDVTLSTYQSNTSSTYTLSFLTGSNGRLISNSSTITIRFPSDTDISSATATIDGFAASASISNNDLILTIPASASILNDESVAIVVSNVTNPTTIADYQLELKSSVETTFVQSETYPINNSTPLNITNYTVSNDTVNAPTDITIDFSTDASGQLTSGAGTITLYFPSSAFVPNSIDPSTITVENLSTPSSSVVTTATSNFALKTVTITTPVTIGNSENSRIIIDETSTILNPGEPDAYTTEVNTSAQIVKSNSPDFTLLPSLGSFITDLNVSVSPSSINIPVNWTWTFFTGSRGALVPGRGTITLDFAQSVFNIASPPSSAFRINNVQVTTINKVGSEIILTVPNSVTIGNSSAVTISISTAAGIQVDPNLGTSSFPGKGDESLLPSILESNEYSVESSSEPTEQSNPINPLPVELISFTAQLDEENCIKLNWNTATERENYGFQIYKSFISNEPLKSVEKPDTVWNEIAFIEGAGTTVETQVYSYLDPSITEAGKYIYRLTQIDFDGREENFGPIEVLYTGPQEFSLNQNYPNPFNPTTTIPYNIAERSQVRIDVFNMLGQRVRTLANKVQNPGAYKLNFEARELASGVYFVRMVTNNKMFVKKMLLIK